MLIIILIGGYMTITGGETKEFYQLFSNDASNIKEFLIPKYQRDYVWSKTQIQQLINDIDENELGHFLGTIILYSARKQGNKTTINEIIDGQQRITTLSLILSRLYKEFQTIWQQCNGQITNQDLMGKYFSTKEKIKNALLIDSTNPRLTLAITNKNNDKYIHALYLNKVLTEDINCPNFGNTGFGHSVKYIDDLITSILDDFQDVQERVQGLINYSEKVLSVIIAPISTDNYSDAYKLFECINNRGMELSAIELIKNIAFRTYTSKKENNNIDDIDKKWQKIIDNLGSANIQTRFLRHYYNAFKFKENIFQKSISKATTSNISKIYEELIKKDVDNLLHEFTQKSEIYSFLINETIMPEHIKQDLIRLKRVGFVPAYTFLLYLLNEYPQNNDLQKQVTNFLVKYGFRRNLTDYPRTRNLDQMFIDLIADCESHKPNLTFENIRNFLTQEKYFVPLAEVKDRLNGNIYEDNSDLTRFMLCELQESMEHPTKERPAPDLWEKNENNKYIFEIEHILPQNADLSNYWVNMIADGNIEKANEIRNQYTHKIGNLTLSAYNQRLGTMSFEQKKTRTDDEGRPIGYNNGLAINSDLKDEITWNAEKIKTRSEKFINQIIQLYKIDGIDEI